MDLGFSWGRGPRNKSCRDVVRILHEDQNASGGLENVGTSEICPNESLKLKGTPMGRYIPANYG